MKKIIIIILSLCLILSILSGCDIIGEPSSPTLVPGSFEGDFETMDIYGNGYNNNMIVGFDEYGRTIKSASGEKEKREIGIFYFVWLGYPQATGIYDVSKIIKEYGQDVVFQKKDDVISPVGQAHWWAEPLYGYYNSQDKWIIRKHLEMLTEAGVDFLIFDMTNTVLYESAVKRIMNITIELRNEGWESPQIVCYTHSRSIETIGRIYNNFYSDPSYEDAWYKVDGKPMIIGYTDAKKDLAEAASRGDTSYKTEDLDQKYQDFFYIKEACWPNDEHNDNSFPYTEWVYPQPLNGNTMNVSVATHPMVPFSFSLTHENWCNWGRGFDVVTRTNKHEDIYKGTFFQSEWETVFEMNPEMIMITGWNEWVAYKQWYLEEYMLCDNVDLEYSRDIEPMLGEYEDAYYIQMCANIRKYKYNSTDEVIADNVYKTIDINGSDSQWNDIKAIYRHVGTDNTARNFSGAATTIPKYETPAADNNIISIKVTNDSEYLYFRAESTEDIVVKDSANWMNLFIGLGSPTEKGWESYEYAINRSRSGGKAAIESLSPDYTGKNIGSCDFVVSGKYVYYKIPLNLIGFEGCTSTYGQIYFKLADSVIDASEIMNYYASGRSMPMGRLSYEYRFKFK